MASVTDQRGILTDSDLAYLRGEQEYSDPRNERKAATRIRARVREGLADMCAVFVYMDRDDRRQILNTYFDEEVPLYDHLTGLNIPEGSPESRWDIIERPDDRRNAISTGGLLHTQAFVMLFLRDALIYDDKPSAFEFEEIAQELVSEGIALAYGKAGDVVDVDVDIDITPRDVDPEELRTRFEEEMAEEEFDEISDEDVKRLISLKLIDWGEFDEYLERVHRDSD